MTAPATLPPTRRPRVVPIAPPVPPLRDGDRMDAEEFLRRYWATSEDFRAELIGGVVHVSSPAGLLKTPAEGHGDPLFDLITWLGIYRTSVSGVVGATDATTVLGPRAVPQPDACLRIQPEAGGQSGRTADDLIDGPPEFVAEVANSSTRTDLGPKLEDYRAAGVREYLVWRTADGELDWFVLRGTGDAARFEPLAGDGGILKSEAFPGLWLDRAALLRRDMRAVLAALRRGLESPAHHAFASRLEAALAAHAAGDAP